MGSGRTLMISKTFTKTGKSCRLTFRYRAQEPVGSVNLVGDFNGWDEASHPMARRKDGSFSTTVSLPAGKSYRFRYLLDGRTWVNDDAPDGVENNVFGSQDCVVSL